MADATTRILSVQLDATQAINGIVRLNDAIAANTEQMRKNDAQMKQNEADIKNGSNRTMELTQKNRELAKANELLAIETKELKNEKRVLQKEVQNEIKIQSQAQGSMKQLEAELKKLKLEYKQLGDVEREHGRRGKELRDSINKTATELKKAEFGIQEYYRNVGNYQNAILNSIGMNNMWIRSFMDMSMMTQNASVGMKGAFSAIGSSAKALGASLSALLTNPVFLAIAGIAGAGMAFKWFYDYNMGIAEATRRTREFTGLVGSELDNLRANIQATADVYGKEYMDVLKGVDTLMSDFDISAQEAMDTLNAGFQAGADLNGDMLDKIQQYAPALKDAGLSAQEFMVLIQKTRSGIFTDKGLDAITQGSIRIREMSNRTREALKAIGIDADEMEKRLSDGTMKTFQALAIISNKLKEMPDDASVTGEAIAAVFGRQGRAALQEMIEGFGDMNLSLEDCKLSTGEYGELTDQLREKHVELEEEMASMFGTNAEGFENMITSAKIFIIDGIISAIKWLKQEVNWFKNLWNGSKAVRAAFAALVGVIRVFFTIQMQGWKAVWNGIKAIMDAFGKFSNALKTVARNIGNAFQGLVDIFNGILDRDPQKVLNGINKAAHSSIEAVKSLTGGMKDTFNAALGHMGANLGNFMGNLIDDFDHVNDMMNFTFDMGGGGYSSSWGGGDEDKDKKPPKPDPNSNGSGSKGGSSGSGSNNTESEEAKKIKELAAQLLKEAQQLEVKSQQQMAKLSEEGIRAYYKTLKKNLEDKYALLGDKLKDKTSEEGKAFDKLMKDLEKQEEQAVKDFKTKTLSDYLQTQIDGLMEGTKERYEIQIQQLELQMNNELAKYEQNEQMKTAIQQKYAKKRADLDASYAKSQLEFQQKYIQLQLDGMDAERGDQEERFKLQLQLLDYQRQQELAQYENNEEMKAAVRKKYQLLEENETLNHNQKMVELEMQKYEAIASVTGGLSQLLDEFSEDNRDAAIAAKALALGEIMVSQAVAIANAVAAGSKAANPWQMIAQIAASVTAVAVAMAQAFKSFNQAKFATGGYISGAGTSTSDSIPIRVSNGESVINANTTSMFGGLLSSLNQLGGGVPIQVQQTAQSVQGEDMLARAFARGVAMLPNPVVSVEDINKGQRQVEVMNDRATL